MKRVLLNLKLLILIVELVKYFPYWSDSSQHWQQSHFYIDKGTYHNKATRISKCYKKGSWFGLTKALLAEGDAFFPPLPHIAALLLRKVMRAQRQRELQEKTTSWTINTSSLSHFMSIAIMSIVFLLKKTWELHVWLDRCLWSWSFLTTYACAATLALAKDWQLVHCASLQRNKTSWKPSRARGRCMR